VQSRVDLGSVQVQGVRDRQVNRRGRGPGKMEIVRWTHSDYVFSRNAEARTGVREIAYSSLWVAEVGGGWLLFLKAKENNSSGGKFSMNRTKGMVDGALKGRKSGVAESRLGLSSSRSRTPQGPEKMESVMCPDRLAGGPPWWVIHWAKGGWLSIDLQQGISDCHGWSNGHD
jgi:hypothetical protein